MFNNAQSIKLLETIPTGRVLAAANMAMVCIIILSITAHVTREGFKRSHFHFSFSIRAKAVRISFEIGQLRYEYGGPYSLHILEKEIIDALTTPMLLSCLKHGRQV